MNVKIQSLKFDADKKLIDFAEKKISKLDKFFDKVTSAELTLRIDKDHEKGNKVAVLALEVPGDTLVSDRKSKSFEESIDMCVEAVKKQIDKYKDKQE